MSINYKKLKKTQKREKSINIDPLIVKTITIADYVVFISKWLQNLDKTMSMRRKFTIGKKVDDLTTLLGKMSVKKRRSTAKNLSKLFKTMSVKKTKRSRKKKY